MHCRQARYEYWHGISARKWDLICGEVVQRGRRVSLTFRKVKKDGVCRCAYPYQCDSQLATIPSPHQAHLREEGSAKVPGERVEGAGEGEAGGLVGKEREGGVPEVERVYVHQFYDAIASQFDRYVGPGLCANYQPVWPFSVLFK